MYYKHITIENDASRVTKQFRAIMLSIMIPEASCILIDDVYSTDHWLV